MASGDLLQSLLSGTAPQNVRLFVARGAAPLPPKHMLEALVCLVSDEDPEISSLAAGTLKSWDEMEILQQLSSAACPVSVLRYFASADISSKILEAIIRNPAAPLESIELLAATVSTSLLKAILENRVRILEFPKILEKIKLNPATDPEVQRVIQEIETEFFGEKKRNYVIEAPDEDAGGCTESIELDFEIPSGDLSLEGLPVDPKERQAAIGTRLATLSFREKLRYALFGTREIRAMLIRDSNKEVARMVLRSPKITDNEIEAIAAMRGVSDEILREIGNRKEWIRSYNVVQQLVKNPRTPPLIALRLMSRLRSQDLMLLSKDKSIPEAVRHNATRTLSQRSSARSPQ
jgi:hypothetical protein